MLSAVLTKAELIAVVEGRLRTLLKDRGVAQGGVYSMTGYCVTLAMKVLKVLRERYPGIHAKGIADDVHILLLPATPADIEQLAQWLHEYDALMGEIGQLLEFSKFKLVQSAKAVGSVLDVAQFLHLFPTNEKGEGPEVVRGACAVNGVAVGPCAGRCARWRWLLGIPQW